METSENDRADAPKGNGYDGASTREDSDEARDSVVVHNLRKRFGRQQVLNGVELEVPAKSITCIVGPSGGGKTVLLKHLNLLMRPDSGTIIIDGVEVTHLNTRALNQV